MKLNNIFFTICLIFIFTGGLYIGSVLQFNRDAAVVQRYVDNYTTINPSCIPCECYTPDPNRYVPRPAKTEELKAVVIESQRLCG